MKKFVSVICLLLFMLNIMAIPAASEIKSEENNYLKIERTSLNLHSRLSNKYKGYDCKIINKTDVPIKIENISIWNNAGEQIAYLSVKRSNKEAASKPMSKGLSYAVPTLSLSLIGAAIVTPFVVTGNAIGNSKAQKEAKKFDKKPTLPKDLKASEIMQIRTMALHKHEPRLIVKFVNPITEEVMNIELK